MGLNKAPAGAGPASAVAEPPRASPPLPPALAPLAEELARLERHLLDGSDTGLPLLRRFLDWIFASGGKRIRPALVFASARLGPSDPEAALALAAAMETLHAATLVHDDLVDEALTRRGLPTLNTRWSAGATVLAGDWLFARAARFAADTGNLRVVRIFARLLGTLTDGELRQLFGRRGVPGRDEYGYRIYAKTASLFEAATEAAAVLNGMDEAEIQALARFGRELGMAFQVVDDILDFTSTEARLGKPVGSDLRGGTITLPALYYLEAHPETRPWLDGEADAGPERLDELVLAIGADAAAIAAARAEAEAHVARAMEALAGFPDGPAREQLARIARYAVDRDH